MLLLGLSENTIVQSSEICDINLLLQEYGTITDLPLDRQIVSQFLFDIQLTINLECQSTLLGVELVRNYYYEVVLVQVAQVAVEIAKLLFRLETKQKWLVVRMSAIRRNWSLIAIYYICILLM